MSLCFLVHFEVRITLSSIVIFQWHNHNYITRLQFSPVVHTLPTFPTNDVIQCIICLKPVAFLSRVSLAFPILIKCFTRVSSFYLSRL